MTNQTPVAPTLLAAHNIGPRPGFGACVYVEVRKLLDTRLAWVLGLAVLGLIDAFTGSATPLHDDSYNTIATTARTPVGNTLSILAAPTITSEFSNRSIATTIPAEPDRLRLPATKATTVALAAVSTTLTTYAVALIAAPVSAHWQDRTINWDHEITVLNIYLPPFHSVTLVPTEAYDALVFANAATPTTPL